MLYYGSTEKRVEGTPALRSRLVKIQIIQTTMAWMAPGKGTDYILHTIYILSLSREAGGGDSSSQISAGKDSNHSNHNGTDGTM